MKITVIGCGNGAFATAADMASKGHEVTIYVDPSHGKNFDVIGETNTIVCYGKGIHGAVRLSAVTCDTEEALRDPDLIIVCIPAFAHEDVAHRIAPHLKDGTKILLSPGSTGGALVFSRIFREHSKAKNIRFAEFHTLPYTARKIGADGVNVLLVLNDLMFAAFPASHTEEMFALIKPLYPQIRAVHDVLETGLNNGNATTHPAPVVLNAGKIEYYGRHKHYEEGMTPSVCVVVQQIDDERKAICRAFGYEEIDIKERLKRMGYCPKKETLYECIRGSQEVFLPIEGPNELSGRYLVEDTPCSLVAMSALAEIAGCATPLMDAVISLAGALRGEEYRKTGRTLAAMGLDGMTVDEIRRYLMYGAAE